MAALRRNMSASRSPLSHLERTAHSPRQPALHPVLLSRITQANPQIRLLQLSIPTPNPILFLPGQWLDVHVRGLSKAGGFTITSTPKDAEAKPPRAGYLELAVQASPRNPAAAWLWRPKEEILGEGLLVRVGSSFVWPPPGMDVEKVDRVVLVAGGVGINPLISILSHLYDQPEILPKCIRVLYSTRPVTAEVTDILFYTRIRKLMSSNPSAERTLDLFRTGSALSLTLSNDDQGVPEGAYVHHRRILHHDLASALGPVQERNGAIVYVCGPAQMTDELVEVLRKSDGMEEQRVLCEKWW